MLNNMKSDLRLPSIWPVNGKSGHGIGAAVSEFISADDFTVRRCHGC